MTKQELRILKNCAYRIEELASLEKASFSMNKEEDEEIKKAIRPYMMWFNIVSYNINELVKAQDETGTIKRLTLDEIERYSR